MPSGTTSNYFSRRAELLDQVARRVLERLQPQPAQLDAARSASPTRALDLQLMRELMDRVNADRAGFLALLELRLEASRRPELRAALTATMHQELEANVTFHLDTGFPGDRSTVLVLYLAMTGLMFEHLTLPDVLGPDSLDELVAMIVDTVVPPSRARRRRGRCSSGAQRRAVQVGSGPGGQRPHEVDETVSPARGG